MLIIFLCISITLNIILFIVSYKSLERLTLFYSELELQLENFFILFDKINTIANTSVLSAEPIVQELVFTTKLIHTNIFELIQLLKIFGEFNENKSTNKEPDTNKNEEN